LGDPSPNPCLPPELGAHPPYSCVVTPACYCNFGEFASCAKCVLLFSKRNKVTTVNALFLLLPHFLHLFFTSNSVVLLTRGACKNISCPKVQGTLATPLLPETLQQQSVWAEVDMDGNCRPWEHTSAICSNSRT